MARRLKNYVNRRNGKIAGVCSTLGDIFAIDPTIIRVAFVAFALMIEPQVALLAYIGAAVFFAVKRRQQRRVPERVSDFERMDFAVRPSRSSIHALRTELEPIDRRLMAIDAHIARPNHELAREIEALREEK